MNTKSVALSFGTFLFATSVLTVAAQTKPSVLGRGLERFQVGELLHRDDFENLENWIVQIERKDGFQEPQVVAKNQTLDCCLPGRGCTIWFKEKLQNRLTITYEVVCPVPEEGVRDLQPKDVNNFWLASDPRDPAAGLFDAGRYDGGFNSYHKMNGYYASTGGGKNTTTRMRRYPREKGGGSVEHIALNGRDRNSKYMISPGKLMKVQLVAFDDLIQYVVDGELVYEISYGDEVSTEKVLHGKKKQQGADRYDVHKFPFYREGFFGFRMVGTHHIYSAFRVYELEPVQKQAKNPDAVTEPN